MSGPCSCYDLHGFSPDPTCPAHSIEPTVHTCSYCQKFTACQEYEEFWFCLARCWEKRHKLITQVRKNA